MEKIELDILALSHNVSQANNYAVVLGEVDGSRRLPIIIGAFEAQAIAVAMENMASARPLTHDLFKNALESFKIDLKEVIVSNLKEGVFFARLICEKDGEVYEIDSRTSDALALAVRFDCPIYTYDSILESAGLDSDVSTAKSPAKKTRRKSSKTPITKMSISELEEELERVLKKENYEKAAEIRDEMNRRQNET